MLIKKKGQVWIETVTYTLVAFVLIGLVLAFAKPKIEESQDKAIIEQTIKMMKQMDATMQEVTEEGIGNKRKIEFNIKKGEFTINASTNTLIFKLEGKHMFSEPGKPHEEAGLKISTIQYGKEYHVTLEKSYTDLNLTYIDNKEDKKLPKATTAYTIFITNKGGSPTTVDFEVI